MLVCESRAGLFFFSTVVWNLSHQRASRRVCLCFLPCLKEGWYKASVDNPSKKIVLTYYIRLSWSCWQGPRKYAIKTVGCKHDGSKIGGRMHLQSAVQAVISAWLSVAVRGPQFLMPAAKPGFIAFYINIHKRTRLPFMKLCICFCSPLAFP